VPTRPNVDNNERIDGLLNDIRPRCHVARLESEKRWCPDAEIIVGKAGRRAVKECFGRPKSVDRPSFNVKV
jgi:hypothetical protein